MEVQIQQQRFQIQAGDIVLVNTTHIHSITKTEEENICLFIQVPKMFFKRDRDEKRDYIFYLNSQGTECRLKQEQYDAFIEIVAQIGLAAMTGKEIGRFQYLWGCVFLFAGKLLAETKYDIIQGHTGVQKENDSALLAHIFDYIQKNYRDTQLIDKIYKDLGISEKTMYRFLKSTIDMSVRDVVINYKINASVDLLKLTDKPINDIADECGFDSVNTYY